MSFVAILKHIAVKNSDYGQMQQYLLFQHERGAGKPMLDDEGRLGPHEAILIDGINCEPFSFPMEWVELNWQWGKNSGFGEIKAHHYIISFNPRDGQDRGLTPEKVYKTRPENESPSSEAPRANAYMRKRWFQYNARAQTD